MMNANRIQTVQIFNTYILILLLNAQKYSERNVFIVVLHYFFTSAPQVYKGCAVFLYVNIKPKDCNSQDDTDFVQSSFP